MQDITYKNLICSILMFGCENPIILGNVSMIPQIPDETPVLNCFEYILVHHRSAQQQLNLKISETQIFRLNENISFKYCLSASKVGL